MKIVLIHGQNHKGSTYMMVGCSQTVELRLRECDIL